MRTPFVAILLAISGVWVSAKASPIPTPTPAPVAAPTPNPIPPAEAAQFDFWVGEWDLTYAGGGTGTNRITKDFDGWVVREDFDGGASTLLKGMSVSTWNIRTKQWDQTWVDNTGGYLAFTGGLEGERMILARSGVNAKGQAVRQRMVFYNISKDQLDWNWEGSTDDGKTWTVNWQIHYVRRQPK